MLSICLRITKAGVAGDVRTARQSSSARHSLQRGKMTTGALKQGSRTVWRNEHQRERNQVSMLAY